MTAQSIATEHAVVPGPVGDLEGLVDIRDSALVASIAVVCHPHPQHQGTMHNKVAYTLARTFARQGAAAIRFNFRGVGESAGKYADGIGEIEDALAVTSWAQRRWPSRPVYLAGFSFGGRVALRAAVDVAPAGLVTVAPAVQTVDFEFQHPGCPWLIVQGEDDDIVPADAVERFCRSISPQPELQLISGAGHFFHGKLGAVASAVQAFFR